MTDFQIKILNMCETDSGRISEIARECCLEKWTEEDYKQEANRKNSIALIATADRIEDRDIVGFLIARLHLTEQNETSDALHPFENYEMDILNIGVIRRYRKKGVGGLLLEQSKRVASREKASDVWLEVRESNLDAVEFYQKRGFEKIQKRNKFYSNPTENAVVMKLVLDRQLSQSKT
ncbi:MAG: GNAT family N-acetyltransferase [Pyrinomonadaceae bacterium]